MRKDNEFSLHPTEELPLEFKMEVHREMVPTVELNL
jgi:hypothetical protein